MPRNFQEYPDFRIPVAQVRAQEAASRKRSLGILAIILIVLMGVVAVAGLDGLPRSLKASVKAAESSITADKSRFEEHRQFVERALRDEPELFRTKADGWKTRLAADKSRISAAEAQAATLAAVAKENKRSDEDKVAAGLRQFEADRSAAVTDVESMRVEAARWLGYKRDLPARLTSMERAHAAIAAFDVAAATVPATKAMTDWPAKKDDLQARRDALDKAKADAERVWESSAEQRKLAATADRKGLDYAALFQTADQLDQTQKLLTDGSATVNRMAGQLYESWDKLLLEVDDEDSSREKIRLVRTRFPDASLKDGKVSQEEKWETVDASLGRQRERHAGMVVERKGAGKYDSEAEKTAQAPAYAYVAPPGQSNAYGSWNNGVWNWLPQYLILRELLQYNSRGAITYGDWNRYNTARRSGDVWYGPGNVFNRGSSRRSSDRWTWSGKTYSGKDGGGFYHEREKPSWGSRGYGSSQYKSRGTFSGSRYQSRGSFGSRSYSRGSFRMGGRGGRR